MDTQRKSTSFPFWQGPYCPSQLPLKTHSYISRYRQDYFILRSLEKYLLNVATNFQLTRKKRCTKVPVPDRKLKEEDLALLRDLTADVWDPTYTGDWRIMSFPEKTQVEVVDSIGETKMVQISNVRYILSADRVICNLPGYQSFGRQSKLMLDPQYITTLKQNPL